MSDSEHYRSIGRRRRRSASPERLILPVAIVAAMVAIPAISVSVSEPTGVAHAEKRTKVVSVDQDRTAEVRRTLRARVSEDKLDRMKRDYLKGRNSDLLRADLDRFAGDIAAGDYVHIPHEIRQIIQSSLSPSEIRDLKEWIKTEKPSKRELIGVAKREFATHFEDLADEMMLSKDEMAVERDAPRRPTDTPRR